MLNNSRKLLLFTVGLSLFISGCATPTIKSQRSAFDGKNVVIVPKGAIEFRNINSAAGMFGIIGMAVALADSQQKDRNLEKAKSTSSVTEMSASAGNVASNDFLFTAATSALKSSLISGAKPKNITILRRVPAGPDWYTKDTRIDSLSSVESQTVDVTIEVGIPVLVANTYIPGRFAEGFVVVRIIDNRSGKVLGQSQHDLAGAFGEAKGEKLNLETGDPKYLAHLNEAFERVVSRATAGAIRKIIE